MSEALEHFEQGKTQDALEALARDGLAANSHESRKLGALIAFKADRWQEAKIRLSLCSDSDPQIWKMRGHCAFMLTEFELGKVCYEQALALNPGYAEAAHDVAVDLSAMGEHAEALRYMKMAARLNPSWILARSDLGLMKLTAGDESGWDEYRWRHEARGDKRPEYREPHWDGEEIVGKRFFLLCEQGYGDQIQYMRYARWLADRGAHVMLGVHEKIKRLANLQSGVREVYTMGGPVKDFDVWALSMDMPRLCGGIASMGPASVFMGRSRVPSEQLVGLVWKGNPDCKAEIHRRVGLAALEPVISEFPCVSMQFDPGDGVEDHGLPDLTKNCFDFLDSGLRMLEHLSVLVTTDSGIAHLAGSIGLPTVLMLNPSPDFRWTLQKPEFYYPSVRPVWATTYDWNDAIPEVVRAVREILS